MTDLYGDHDYDYDYDEENDEDDVQWSSCPWDISSDNLDEELWSDLWENVNHTEIDPAQAAADFYLLFGIANDAFVQFKPMEVPSFEELQYAGKILDRSGVEITEQFLYFQKLKEHDPRVRLSDIQKKASEDFYHLVEMLDQSFREYVHLACGGELRHHGSMYALLGEVHRKGAWARWFHIYNKFGNKAIEDMVTMFREFPDSGFGGKRWADAAHILWQRETGKLAEDSHTNKQIFVDRVFSLEHNGGCFLNKLNWVNLRDQRSSPYNVHFEEMKDYVLNAHAADITDIDMLYGFASFPVRLLLEEYLGLANKFNMPILGQWQGVQNEIKKFNHKEFVEPKVNVINWSEEEEKEKVIISPMAEKLKEKLLNDLKSPSEKLKEESKDLGSLVAEKLDITFVNLDEPEDPKLFTSQYITGSTVWDSTVWEVVDPKLVAKPDPA